MHGRFILLLTLGCTELLVSLRRGSGGGVEGGRVRGLCSMGGGWVRKGGGWKQAGAETGPVLVPRYVPVANNFLSLICVFLPRL